LADRVDSKIEQSNSAVAGLTKEVSKNLEHETRGTSNEIASLKLEVNNEMAAVRRDVSHERQEFSEER
jgi:hypothetical protein